MYGVAPWFTSLTVISPIVLHFADVVAVMSRDFLSWPDLLDYTVYEKSAEKSIHTTNAMVFLRGPLKNPESY